MAEAVKKHVIEKPRQDMRGEDDNIVHPTTEEVQRAIHRNYDAWRKAEDEKMAAFAEAAEKTEKAHAEAYDKVRSLEAGPSGSYKTRAATPVAHEAPKK